MTKCPNCGYELVLLEKRMKYKCAKCGKIFPKKEIDEKEFKEWNKQQREDDWKEIHPKSKLTRTKARFNKKEYQKRWREKNKERLRKYSQKYYFIHRDTLVIKKKEYRKGLNGQQKKEQNEKRKTRRYKNIEDTRLQGRINYWKQQQKALALEMYENKLNTACNVQFHGLLPTLVLPQLLN